MKISKMDKYIKSNIKDSYNKNAHMRNHNFIENWKEQEILKVLAKVDMKKELKLLDLGAGNGIYAKYFKDKGIDVSCIDLSEEMINLCLKKELKAKVMDFYDLKFDESSFDIVWSLNTLLHVSKENIEKVLKQIKKVLKPNGIFYLGMYGGENFEGIWKDDSYYPQRFFSFYEDSLIKEIVGKYFDIVGFDSIDIENRHSKFQSIISIKIKI